MEHFAISGALPDGEVLEPDYGYHEDPKAAATSYYARRTSCPASIADQKGFDMAGRLQFTVVGKGGQATIFVRRVNGRVSSHE